MNKIGKIFIIIGLVEIISGVLVYPAIAVHWRSEIITNYYVPMKHYFYFALIIGIVTCFIGLCLILKKGNMLSNLSLLFLVLSVIFLSDRLLLAKYGTGLWEYDEVLHYKHRPNSTFTWGEQFNNKLIKINSEGFHDNEFTIEKSKDEVRIFALGNSITMGHGVTKEETFSSQLEYYSLFGKKINVFNLGVQGYSTEQELEVFNREIKYNPDVVMLEFCLNDITEPIAIDKRYGGTGFDYHMIFQASSSVLGFFVNETGFGRLYYRLKFKQKILDARKEELEQIKKLTINPFLNKKVKESWEIAFHSINQIKLICNKRKIPFLVLIFPYTFQFWDENLQEPQRVLRSFLISQKIAFIDLTEILEKKLSKKQIGNYFLDEDHYTVQGHHLIANEIYKYLYDNKLLYVLE